MAGMIGFSVVFVNKDTISLFPSGLFSALCISVNLYIEACDLFTSSSYAATIERSYFLNSPQPPITVHSHLDLQ
jgi:hypothetical protein